MSIKCKWPTTCFYCGHPIEPGQQMDCNDETSHGSDLMDGWAHSECMPDEDEE